MNRWLARMLSLPLLLVLLSGYLIAVENEDEAADNEEVVQEDLDKLSPQEEERLRKLAAQMVEDEFQRQRSDDFSFKVVDQFDQPVSGVPVLLRTTVPRRVNPLRENPMGGEEIVRKTDDLGQAQFSSVKYQHLTAKPWIYDEPHGLLPDVERGADAFSRSWYRDRQALAAGEPLPPTSATFRVYRMQGPRQMARWTGMLLRPADGTPWTWNLHGRMPAQRGGPAAEWEGPGDIEVRLWRDPEVPLVSDDGNRVNADWWVELRWLRGGYAAAPEKWAFLAPEEGYRQVWRQRFNVADPDYKDRTWLRVYWRRTGTPVRFGYMTMEIRHPTTIIGTEFQLRTDIWLNMEGDRILERGFPGEREYWVPSNQVHQVIVHEPLDAGAIPLPDVDTPSWQP